MSERVIYVDRFQINEGKLDELRRYAADIAAIAEEQVQGVLSFHYYVDDAGERGTALIVFADAQALDQYLAAASAQFQRGLELVSSNEIELLGEPSHQAADAANGYGGRVLPEIAGFDR